MKNPLDDTTTDAEESPLKKIKLEEPVDDSASLHISIEGPMTTTSASGRGRARGRGRGKGRGKARVGLPKTSTEERAQELLNDPRISAVDPRRVLCRMCGSWIRLFKHTDYAPANWRTHADRCEIRTQWRLRVKQEPGIMLDLPVASISESRAQTDESLLAREIIEALGEPVVESPGQQAEQVAEPVVDGVIGEVQVVEQSEPSASTSRSRPRRGLSSEERKQRLLEDTRIAEVQAHQVVCGICKTLVRLHNIREYDTYNWRRHVERCETLSANPEGSVRKRKRPVRSSLAEALVNDSTPIDDAIAATTQSVDETPSTHPPVQLSPAPVIKQEISDSLCLLYPPEPSIASSSRPRQKKRKARGLEERKQSLQDDPRCDFVQPGEVFCLMCRSWIKLYKDVPYIDANWTRHATRCQIRNNWSVQYDRHDSDDESVGSSGNESEQAVVEIEAAGRKDQYNDASLTQHPPPGLHTEEKPGNFCSKCNANYIGSRLRHEILCQRPQLQKQLSLSTKHSTLIPDSISTSQLNAPAAPVAASSTISAPVKSVKSDVVVTTGPSSNANKWKDNRTTEERRQELENDPRCDKVEQFRVFCKMCQRYVGLHAKKEYSTSNWYKHAKSCEAKGGVPSRRKVIAEPSPEIQLIYPEDELSASRAPAEASASLPTVKLELDIESEMGLLNAPMSAVTPNSSAESSTPVSLGGDGPSESISTGKSSVKRRFTAEQRLERLKADTRIKSIEPHQLQCGLCDKWIRLQSRTEYDIHNWLAHVDKCELRQKKSAAAASGKHWLGDLPDDGPWRVKRKEKDQLPTPPPTASQIKRVDERIDEISRDARVEQHEPNKILCKLCSQWIKLRDEQPYVLYNWYKHVNSCERRRAGPTAPYRAPKKEYVEPSLSAPVKYSFRARHAQAQPEKPEKAQIFDPQYTSAHAPDSRKKSDVEREAFLRADPRQSGVERGRVLCSMCQSWVRLNTSSGFLPGNWLRHAERCQKKNGWQGPVPTVEAKPVYIPPEIIDLVQEDEETGEPIPPGTYGCVQLGEIVDSFEPTHTSLEYGVKLDELSGPNISMSAAPLSSRMGAINSKPSTPVRDNSSVSALHRLALETNLAASHNGKRPHRGTEYRKLELEADPRTKTVEPDRILCGMCDRWIATRKDVDYSGQNWQKHAGICEVRSGWLKRYKEGQTSVSTPATPIGSEGPDENIPYTARKHAQADYLFYKPLPTADAAPEGDDNISTSDSAVTFKPVEWGEEIDTDDEDDGQVDASDFPAEIVQKYQAKWAPVMNVPMTFQMSSFGFHPGNIHPYAPMAVPAFIHSSTPPPVALTSPFTTAPLRSKSSTPVPVPSPVPTATASTSRSSLQDARVLLQEQRERLKVLKEQAAATSTQLLPAPILPPVPGSASAAATIAIASGSSPAQAAESAFSVQKPKQPINYHIPILRLSPLVPSNASQSQSATQPFTKQSMLS